MRRAVAMSAQALKRAFSSSESASRASARLPDAEFLSSCQRPEPCPCRASGRSGVAQRWRRSSRSQRTSRRARNAPFRRHHPRRCRRSASQSRSLPWPHSGRAPQPGTTLTASPTQTSPGHVPRTTKRVADAAGAPAAAGDLGRGHSRCGRRATIIGWPHGVPVDTEPVIPTPASAHSTSGPTGGRTGKPRPPIRPNVTRPTRRTSDDGNQGASSRCTSATSARPGTWAPSLRETSEFCSASFTECRERRRGEACEPANLARTSP